MKAWTGAAALAGIMASGSAMAANGNDLLKACQNTVKFDDTGVLDDGVRTGFCLGVMDTAISLMVYLNTGFKPEYHVCLPEGITNAQAARIIVKYLKENPAKLDQGSSSLTVFALRDSYPCKK